MSLVTVPMDDVSTTSSPPGGKDIEMDSEAVPAHTGSQDLPAQEVDNGHGEKAMDLDSETEEQGKQGTGET